MQRLMELATLLQESATGVALLMLLAKVTLVASIGRLIMAAMPRASASTRYLVAVTTFCSMLAVPLIPAAGLEWRLSILPSQSKSAPAITTADEAIVKSDAQVDVTADPIASSAAPAAEIAAAAGASWRGWLLLAMVAMAAGFVARMIVGITAMGWITARAREVKDDALMRDFDVACRQLGITRSVRLLVSERMAVPLLWGITRPALLLPAEAPQWSRDRLRVVFLHELAHLRRGDAVTLIVTCAAAALYWFHPLVWSLDRAARRDREQACDDLVLASGTRPSDYADHLLHIARSLRKRDPFAAVTLAMSRPSQLEDRLLSILQPHVRRKAASRRAAMAVAVAAAIVVVPIAAVRLTAEPATIVPRLAFKVPIEAQPDESSPPAPTERQLRRSDEREGKEAFAAARDAYRDDHYKESIDHYKRAVEMGYRPATAMYNIACDYALLNERENALQWLEKAINAGFDEVSTIASDDDLDSIRSDPRFERIVGHAPDAARQARERKAVDQYASLRASDSRNADDWYAAGNKLLKARDFAHAIEAYSNAVRIDPFAGSAWYNMACAYSLSGDTSRALSTLEQSLLHGFGGDGDKLLGDRDLAAVRSARLDELAKLADDLSLSSFEFFGWRSTIPHYEEMARAHPAVGRAWFNLGYAQVEGGSERAAIESFNRALQMNYRPGTTMYNLGCAYARLGDSRTAMSWLMKAGQSGFDVGAHARHDRDLDNVRDEPWLRERIGEARRKEE